METYVGRRFEDGERIPFPEPQKAIPPPGGGAALILYVHYYIRIPMIVNPHTMLHCKGTYKIL